MSMKYRTAPIPNFTDSLSTKYTAIKCIYNS